MEDALLFLKLGFYHVLDLKAYDHILFLIVLAVIYNFKDWKKVLWMVTFFTIGHSITLSLAAYKLLHVDSAIVEFLIPLTIFLTAFINIFFSKKSQIETENKINILLALVFGLIHGLGFSSYFSILVGKSESKIFPLIQFALGIEFAQIIIVILVLSAGFFFKKVFGITRRDWILVVSSLVAGIVLPMLIERIFW